MRIAIIGSRGIPARYGGFETFAQELAPRLVELGHEVTVYCREGYTGDPPPSEYLGVRLTHTRYVHRRSVETLSHEFTSIADSMRRPFDLYYFLGTRGSPLYVLLRLTRRRVVVHTDGLEWKRRKWGVAGRTYLKFAEWVAARLAADVLVTDSASMQTHYLSRYGRESTTITYGARVVSAADPAVLRRYELQADGYYLVVCRIEPENNVDLIVRGFLESDSARELIIVGGSNYETSYQRRVRGLAQDGKISFLGGVYGDDLESVRAGAYAYLHGHEVGGVNPSLLEAMGCGCCSLALDTEFNREALGETGLYWEKSAASLASLIRRIDADPQMREGLGSSARELVAADHDWGSVAVAHDALFRGLAKG